MLRCRTLINWQFLIALFLFLGFWFFALTGLLLSPIEFSHPPSASSGTSHSNNKSESIDPNERLANYTFWLMLFTGALVGFGGLQIRLLFKSDKTARLNVAIARKQMRLTGYQADILTKQKEIARIEFIATHRPRLRVRNVVVKPVSVTGFKPTVFHPGQFVSGQCYIANSGGSAAHITEAHCDVFITSNPLPMERPYEGQDGNSAIKLTIEAGTSVPLPFQSTSQISSRESEDILSGGNYRIYVMGWVEYSDDMNIMRRTAFCRKYDFIRRRFYPVDDPDYEHEE